MKRKNLLITSIGKIDCLPSWICEDRNFDIVLVYYLEYKDNQVVEQLQKYADFMFFETGFKYNILQTVFKKNKELLNYQYYWMPDDDVKLEKGTVNQLFELSEKYRLGLCQPSTRKKNTSWKILRNVKGYNVAYTNFIEVMCPLFSQKALANCLESFSYTSSGWGLDFLWPTLVSENVGVLHDIVIKHTKKINTKSGTLYTKLKKETGIEPQEELDFIIEKYGLETVPKATKILYADSIFGKVRFLRDKIIPRSYLT